MSESENKIALTQYAHGAGCGCKIAPQVLQEILNGSVKQNENKNLLVGNGSNDDAAVYDLGNGTALISTTDFFMPIVDDPFDFGRVASANAISDVYAMGGTPTLALAILGWPVNKLSPDLAKKVLDGARTVCNEAGIPLAGGHSIDTLEPMFGLSVNGLINIKDLKKNNTAQEGDFLFLTKAIGAGILSTAQKRNVLLEEDKITLVNQLTSLNSIGEKLGKISGVTAMTDVTGFGLLGHLIEMAEGSKLTAQINYNLIPKIKSLASYLSQGTIPDATFRNWNAYQKKVHFGENVNVAEAFSVLPDPQTNGGLLFTVNKNALAEIKALFAENGLDDFTKPIGQMVKKVEKVILVEN
ncbi:selenide, water dikinase SelD [Aurantibacillus circumpalustris]|uniref:selenide, water dikinase SelD n=1 Tax=Aurantibacillus circumpalustris TaxID=3036359 RepID=UPI00295B001D|nr:selenide, water dikinase SelD [Aurantibacillus circumpalustris]